LISSGIVRSKERKPGSACATGTGSLAAASAPAILNGKYVKTKGHCTLKNSAGTGYPVVYEVLEGKAHFLLQKKTWTISCSLEATTGDIVLLPPGYGHVTINPSAEDTLTMANLVSTAFTSDYAFYEKMHGAAFSELTGGIFHKNLAYPAVPPLGKMKNMHSLHNNFGIGNTLSDFMGIDRIAHLLNHPENYRYFLSGQFNA
jgi:glucose-6-phosphate isomerase